MVKNVKAIANILNMLKDLQDKTSSEKNSEIYMCVRARDPREAGSIPELGRSPGVGNGNPLQHS